MIQPIALWTAISLLAFIGALFVYVYVQAIFGRVCGVRVEQVAIGYGLFGRGVLSWQGRNWQWRIGILPIGGLVMGIVTEMVVGRKAAERIAVPLVYVSLLLLLVLAGRMVYADVVWLWRLLAG